MPGRDDDVIPAGGHREFHQGLVRHKHGLKGWSEEFFVIHGSHGISHLNNAKTHRKAELRLYNKSEAHARHHSHHKPKKAVPLTMLTQVRVVPRKHGFQNDEVHFEIETDGHAMLFAAPTDGHGQFITGIKEAVAHLRRNGLFYKEGPVEVLVNSHHSHAHAVKDGEVQPKRKDTWEYLYMFCDVTHKHGGRLRLLDSETDTSPLAKNTFDLSKDCRAILVGMKDRRYCVDIIFAHAKHKETGLRIGVLGGEDEARGWVEGINGVAGLCRAPTAPPVPEHNFLTDKEKREATEEQRPSSSASSSSSALATAAVASASAAASVPASASTLKLAAPDVARTVVTQYGDTGLDSGKLTAKAYKRMLRDHGLIDSRKQIQTPQRTGVVRNGDMYDVWVKIGAGVSKVWSYDNRTEAEQCLTEYMAELGSESLGAAGLGHDTTLEKMDRQAYARQGSIQNLADTLEEKPYGVVDATYGAIPHAFALRENDTAHAEALARAAATHQQALATMSDELDRALEADRERLAVEHERSLAGTRSTADAGVQRAIADERMSHEQAVLAARARHAKQLAAARADKAEQRKRSLQVFENDAASRLQGILDGARTNHESRMAAHKASLDDAHQRTIGAAKEAHAKVLQTELAEMAANQAEAQQRMKAEHDAQLAAALAAADSELAVALDELKVHTDMAKAAKLEAQKRRQKKELSDLLADHDTQLTEHQRVALRKLQETSDAQKELLRKYRFLFIFRIEKEIKSNDALVKRLREDHKKELAAAHTRYVAALHAQQQALTTEHSRVQAARRQLYAEQALAQRTALFAERAKALHHEGRLCQAALKEADEALVAKMKMTLDERRKIGSEAGIEWHAAASEAADQSLTDLESLYAARYTLLRRVVLSALENDPQLDEGGMFHRGLDAAARSSDHALVDEHYTQAVGASPGKAKIRSRMQASAAASHSRWTVLRHENGHLSYHNDVTSENTWVAPSELLKSGWEAEKHRDGSGHIFYHHAGTSESVWDVPLQEGVQVLPWDDRVHGVIATDPEKAVRVGGPGGDDAAW